MSLNDTLRLRVKKEVELTITTAGNPKVIPAYKQGEAVRIINNNVGVVVAVGLAGSVDATSTPEIGIALDFRESHIEYGKQSIGTSDSFYDQIFVDASVSGTKVTVQYMGG